MKEIFRDQNLAVVGLLAGRLREEGIEVFVRNEHLSVTEVNIPTFYPAVCVVDPEDEGAARKLMQVFFEEEKRPLGEDWICASCGEAVPDSMMECWQCQARRPSPEAK
ncbi:MAG: DUF2007 domain-containing protein [Verrucomicrobiota bacterium]